MCDVESLWHPRNGFRLLIALGCAIGLPVMLTKAQLGGSFVPVAYLGCVVLASALGRLLGGVVATLASLALLDYYVIEPGWSFQPYADFAIFAGVGLLIAIVVSGLDKSRVLAHRARLTADAAQARLALISEASRMLAASFDLPATVS
jgi:K+-sensing histidine kinase KdpD